MILSVLVSPYVDDEKSLDESSKIGDRESKLLLALSNKDDVLFDSCSPLPRVTLIHDTYF